MKFKCSLAFNFLAIFLQTNFWIHLLYYWLLDGIYSIFLPFLINSHWVKHKNESINFL